ncbi:mCG146816 [Mus musculus]|nr:mCG146816 [Mus musculus]
MVANNHLQWDPMPSSGVSKDSYSVQCSHINNNNNNNIPKQNTCKMLFSRSQEQDFHT